MSEPNWIATARSLIGTKETPGPGDNQTIVNWAKAFGGWEGSYYLHDSIPWCALFVAHVLDVNGMKPPKGFLSALAWKDWGDECFPAIPGSILVFGRDGGGHVGFYIAEDDSAYHVLGGNQSDAVSITRVAKNRLVSSRWPTGASKGWWSGPVHADASGNLSKSEA